MLAERKGFYLTVLLTRDLEQQQIFQQRPPSQQSFNEYHFTKGYFPVIQWSYIGLSGLNPPVQILRQFLRRCGQNLSLNNVQLNMK